jgi:hypothetical protein
MRCVSSVDADGNKHNSGISLAENEQKATIYPIYARYLHLYTSNKPYL